MKLKWEIKVLCCLGAILMLTGCGSEAKYEEIDIGKVVDTQPETEAQTVELSESQTGSQTEAQTESETEEVIKLTTLPDSVYVKVPVNLLTSPYGTEMGAFVDRGTRLDVIGSKDEDADGKPVYYEVSDGTNEGWIKLWYVTEKYPDAQRPAAAEPNEEGVIPEEEMPGEGTDEYYMTVNSLVPDTWGGGSGADPDYYARDKQMSPHTQMPERVKALYLDARQGGDDFEAFVQLAKTSGINAFVVNITDNGQIAYPSEVMHEFSISAYRAALNTKEDYGARIQRLKDEGFYVIGRIVTFQDDYLAADHPELTICDANGQPKALSNGYWPTPYARRIWQYKVDIAQEAVEWFGFDEIQFDYVRFPDRTQSAEKEGDIDYLNEYGETKVQAIQRFLMYACDRLHECGVYVGADVFGEVSNNYVGGYGQYWPAISNVVDVISGMPYPDHYEATEDYIPWEHPYETVKQFADQVAVRQTECPTPAKVRTWIQGYNAYKEPHIEYYAENVGLEIQALYDAGIKDGFMIWNGANSIKSATNQSAAFSKEP